MHCIRAGSPQHITQLHLFSKIPVKPSGDSGSGRFRVGFDSEFRVLQNVNSKPITPDI